VAGAARLRVVGFFQGRGDWLEARGVRREPMPSQLPPPHGLSVARTQVEASNSMARAKTSFIDPLPGAFVAIDFETADHYPDSACAVGLVRVEHGRVARRVRQLIRPPRDIMLFTGIHGIRLEDVEDKPDF